MSHATSWKEPIQCSLKNSTKGKMSHAIIQKNQGLRYHWLASSVIFSLFFVGIGLGASGSARAETLQGALVKAYESNPTLIAARAGQRAIDENVPIQKSAGLPNANVQGNFRENLVIPGNSFSSPGRLVNASGRLTIPIFQGGAVRNGVRSAKEQVKVGRANLRAIEASLFSQVVGVYMDVIRDQAIVRLSRNNVAVLETNLFATRDRFEIGDLTRTDVAQSEARLALAQGQMRSTEAQLIASRENYVRLIGVVPKKLDQPPVLPGLPEDAEKAVADALGSNADIEAATHQIKASKYDVSAARAQRLPTLSTTIEGSYTNFLNSLGGGIPGVDFAQTTRSVQATVGISIPLFQGGRPSAQIRQAQARSSQAIENYVAVERTVIAHTRAAYASWRASEQVIEATEKAVSANALSLEGVRAENSVGTRSILDILNAEQEYLNAQVQLVTARRDSYVAAFTLLAMMGKAEARDLGLDGGVLYDPQVNYRRVKGQIWDWSDDSAPRQRALSTRTIPAADASITESEKLEKKDSEEENSEEENSEEENSEKENGEAVKLGGQEGYEENQQSAVIKEPGKEPSKSVKPSLQAVRNRVEK